MTLTDQELETLAVERLNSSDKRKMISLRDMQEIYASKGLEPTLANLEAEIQERAQYIKIKTLADGTIVGLGDLAFTRAIYFDCDLCGHAKRFCFDPRWRADEEFDKLTDGDTYPTGWIATRPEPI